MPLSSLRILCVDGNEDTGSMEKVLFEQHGFEVSSAKGVAEAIEVALKGEVDLYLIAYKLKDGTGIELCRRIRDFDQETPILFWSALVYESDRASALEAGASDFLRKPDGLDRLVETATRLIIKSAAEVA